ncbi:hypothetical protein J2I48_12895 [Fibrella sp. HMF5036]|uniref:Uncharacterized protein n=1 Tax=Fibrella aquatilis TaxID=2817059 RepID=A0A939JYB0_9BACT|nr:hypothetical protein [Fibrella aquatilis]
MDQVGPVRQAPTSPADAYPTNPYWSKSGAEVSPPLPNAKPQSAGHPPLFDPHLIGAISEAVHEAGQQHRDELSHLLADWLPQLPTKLTPAVEAHLDKIVPKVVKVEHPGRLLLLLVRWLTAGMVLSGLLVGGLLYGLLHLRQERDAFAPGYWQHRYATAKASVEGSPLLCRWLQGADTLYASPDFKQELTRLENIVEARHQQYLLKQRERALLKAVKQ